MRFKFMVIGVFAALLGGACQKSASTDADARAFAAKMGGKVTDVSCVDYDTDGDGYVSCTIFREGQDPFSIECASGWGFNGGCKVPKLRANVQ